MNISDKVSHFTSRLGSSLKSVAKVAMQSRRVSFPNPEGDTLVILGNGPSLRTVIDEDAPLLASHPCLAVNFAANAPEFVTLRPRYYVLMDPHFFATPMADPNVERLFDNFNRLVSWPMTLFVPAAQAKRLSGIANPNVTVAPFNPVAAEGFGLFERALYGLRLAMPRPRNVLIPSIMIGIWLGYKRIAIVGADHTWLRTLEVDDDNRVVTVQPHFYADNASEKARVTSVYRDVRLHDILLSFHVAFRSYHRIASFARARGVEILNATPGSFIDAFPRIKSLKYL